MASGWLRPTAFARASGGSRRRSRCSPPRCCSSRDSPAGLRRSPSRRPRPRRRRRAWIGEAPVEPRRDEPRRAAIASRAPHRTRARSVSAPVPAPGAEPPAREDPPFSIGPPGSGIALFPPRDTKPIKSGIVVPEDFELPEGYVRHYQANDDGELLAPILLFHPDYEIVDEDGEPIEVPADRVVPPELAPEGLPIQMLEVPGAKGDAAPESRAAPRRARDRSDRGRPRGARAARRARGSRCRGSCWCRGCSALDARARAPVACSPPASSSRSSSRSPSSAGSRAASPPTRPRPPGTAGSRSALLAPLLQPQLLVWSVTRAVLRRRGMRARARSRSPALCVRRDGVDRCRSSSATRSATASCRSGICGRRRISPARPASRSRSLLATRRAARRSAPPGEATPRGAAAPALALARGSSLALFGYGALRLRALDARRADARAAARRPDPGRHQPLRRACARSSAPTTRRASILDAHFALSARGARARTARPARLARDRLSDHLRRAEERGRRGLRPRDRGVRARDRRAARVRRLRRRGAARVQRRHVPRAAAGRRASSSTPTARPSLFPLTERVPALASTRRACAPRCPGSAPGSRARARASSISRWRTAGRSASAPLICYDAVDAASCARGRARRRRAARDALERLLVRRRRRAASAPRRRRRSAASRRGARSCARRTPGISAAIDASGERIAVAGVHERAALVASVVPEREARTLVLAWGDWLGPAALAGLLGLVLLAPRDALA